MYQSGLNSHSSVAEDQGIPVCVRVSVGVQVQIFQRIAVPSSRCSGQRGVHHLNPIVVGSISNYLPLDMVKHPRRLGS